MKTSFALSLLSWAVRSFAGDDAATQTWPSPDLRFTIHHKPSADFGVVYLQDPAYKKAQLATYTLTNKDTVLWSGVSWIDESSHSFRCLWTPDSKFALILDQAGRGTVEACLVQTSSPSRSRVLKIDQMIDALVVGKARESAELTKAWFGEWRFIDGHFEGVLLVSRGMYHRLHLTLDVSAAAPALKLKTRKVSETWDDNFEKL